MDERQLAPEDESAWGETDINLNNYWLHQTDPEDLRSSTLLQSDLAGVNQPLTHNADGYFDNTPAHDGSSLASPTDILWPARPDIELNSMPIDPNLLLDDYATASQSYSSQQAPFNTFHDAPSEGNRIVPLNYHRQPAYHQQGFLYPSASSVLSVQSAPSDIISAQSYPFTSTQFAWTNNSTVQTSDFEDGIPRHPGPGTDQSFGSSSERSFDCDRCTRRFKTRKDLDRHKHTHDPRWPEDQRVEGLFHCRCGKRDQRKDNYKRHHTTCKPNNYKHDTFICKCSFENGDQADHLDHIEACEHFKKRRGRPPGPRARAASCTGG